MSELYRLICGDSLTVLKTLDSESIQTCVTSPPYWGLRDYGIHGQLGMEKTLQEYISRLVEIFQEVKRVLKRDGTFWLNLGDCYAASSNTGGTKSIQGTAKRMGAMTNKNHGIPDGLKPKDLCGIPWHVAFALQDDGWYLRSDIIWAKPNPMPESVTDRPTKSHEYLFLMAKSDRYYYDAESISEAADIKYKARYDSPFNVGVKEVDGAGRPGGGANTPGIKEFSGTRNKRTVWTVPTHSYKEAHFATYPPKLIEPCILAGSRPGDTVLDPFNGSGTTGEVALRNQRKYIGIELNPEYIKLSEKRLSVIAVKLF